MVLALQSHAESAARATVTLLIAVVGTLLAVFVTDIVSHLAVHAALPTSRELRHMLRVSFGSLGALALPFIFLILLGEFVLGCTVVALELLAHG